MSCITVSRLLLQHTKWCPGSTLRSYAKAAGSANVGGLSALGGKKKTGKAGPTLEKKVLPVETDPERLVNYVCGSCIMQTGEDVKLKPDSEYPDWLWELRLGKAPPFDELEYDSPEYWHRVVKTGRRNTQKLMKNRRF